MVEATTTELTQKEVLALDSIEFVPSAKYEPQPFDEEKDYQRHPRAATKGGILMTDEGNIIPDALKDIIKQVGGKIVKGQLSDLMRITSPAKIHSTDSNLELNLHDIALCGTHLYNAAMATDPIERMKWVTSFYIGGQHRAFHITGARIPLNPIIGESLQA